MAVLLNETFETTIPNGPGGSGYDNTWSELVDDFCTLNEDASVPGSPTDPLGLECLYSYVEGAGDSARASHTLGSTYDTIYARFYLYVDTLGCIDGGAETTLVFYVADAGINIAVGVYIEEHTDLVGTPIIRILFYSDGALQVEDDKTIAVDTWYRVEFKYDTVGMSYEWRVDGNTEESGSLVGTIVDDIQIIRAGNDNHGGSLPQEVYIDEVVIDGSNWPGAAESMNIKKRNKNAIEFLLTLDEMRGSPGTYGGMKWI